MLADSAIPFRLRPLGKGYLRLSVGHGEGVDRRTAHLDGAGPSLSEVLSTRLDAILTKAANLGSVQTEYCDVLFFGSRKDSTPAYSFVTNVLSRSLSNCRRGFFLDMREIGGATPLFTQALSHWTRRHLEQHLAGGAASQDYLAYLEQFTLDFIKVHCAYVSRRTTIPQLAVVCDSFSVSSNAFVAAMEGLGVPVLLVKKQVAGQQSEPFTAEWVGVVPKAAFLDSSETISIKGLAEQLTYLLRENSSGKTRQLIALMGVLSRSYQRVRKFAWLVPRSVKMPVRRFLLAKLKRLRVGPKLAYGVDILDKSPDRLQVANQLLMQCDYRVTSRAVMAWFDYLWAKRDPKIREMVADFSAVGRVDDAWLFSVLSDMSGKRLSGDDADYIFSSVQKLRGTACWRAYATQAMTVLLRNGFTGKFLQLAASFGIARLSSNMKVEVARLVFSGPSVVAMTREEFRSQISDYERFKIYSAGVTDVDRGEVLDHADLEGKFIETASASMSHEFKSLIVPSFDALRERMRFVDVRTNPKQLAQFFELISSALDEGRPLSLVRVGDGEGYLFSSGSSPFGPSDCDHREMHWWGTKLDASLRASVQMQSRAAVKDADVLGIPTVHRFFRDFSPKSRSFLSSTNSRGIVTSLIGCAEGPLSASAITEDRVNSLMLSAGQIDALVRRAKRVVFITGLSEKAIADGMSSSTPFRVIEIPSHARSKSNPLFTSWTTPLPYVLDEVMDQVRAVVRQDDLVLVAAGIAGKGLVTAAKRNGAVALDVGSAIDVYVGVPSAVLY